MLIYETENARILVVFHENSFLQLKLKYGDKGKLRGLR